MSKTNQQSQTHLQVSVRGRVLGVFSVVLVKFVRAKIKSLGECESFIHVMLQLQTWIMIIRS